MNPPPARWLVRGKPFEHKAAGGWCQRWHQLSIMVQRSAILPGGFLIVVLFAQRLPVVLIPEQYLIATVRDDVIDNRCQVIHTFLCAFHTERMCSEEQLAGFLPCAVITAICCRPHCLWVKGQVFIAVLRTVGYESGAARVTAGCIGSVRHGKHPLYVSFTVQKKRLAIGNCLCYT